MDHTETLEKNRLSLAITAEPYVNAGQVPANGAVIFMAVRPEVERRKGQETALTDTAATTPRRP